MAKIPTYTIEAPGISDTNLLDVAGVEFQPIDPGAYQLEAGWLCLAAGDDGDDATEYFIGLPESSDYIGVTIQRMEFLNGNADGDWQDIPGARIVGVEWEEI